jgi:hypothetical protein
MIPLYGHVSEETARLVNDYPYGNKRCQIKFWIEENNRGFRFVSQTENPKTLRWNNPRHGTYCLMGMAMFIDDKGHVNHKALTEYSSVDEILTFLQDFPNARVNFNLRAMAMQRAKMAARTARGEHNFIINGTPQMPNEDDIAKAKEEVLTWDKVIELIKSRPSIKP